jgi:hypothetical protein
MDLPEQSTFSFVIKIWVEETAAEAGQSTWRGRIVHVPSGRQRSIVDLRHVAAFIAEHLTAAGLDRGAAWWELADQDRGDAEG